MASRLWVFLFATLGACAGAPSFDAVGVATQETAVVEGVPFIISELQGSRVVLGPDPDRGGGAFQAVVENRTSGPVDIGLDNIRLRTEGGILALSADRLRRSERSRQIMRRVAESREPQLLGAEAETSRVDAQPWYRDEADFAEASGVARHARRGAPCLACLAAAAHLNTAAAPAPVAAFAPRTLSPGQVYASRIAFDAGDALDGAIEVEIEVGNDTHRFQWRRSSG